MSAFNPNMLTIAREANGLTQSELAARIGIVQGTISKIESGLAQPPMDLVGRFGEVLGVPSEFFLERLGLEPLPPTFFRKRVSAPAKVTKIIQAKMNVMRLWLERLNQGAELPEMRVPRIDLEERGFTAEDAAIEVRKLWSLPAGPVESMVKLVEDAGVVVLDADFGTLKVDGLSVPGRGLPPLMIINADTPGDRQRFTIAHELGHLVMHSTEQLADPRVDVEAEANAFASEFLMPAAGIRGHLGALSLANLASLKPYWRVSIAALLMRADALGLLSDWAKRKHWMDLGRLGWRTREPNPVPRESPGLFHELLEMHLEDLGYSEAELALHMRCNVRSLLEHLPGRRAPLSVVK